jgi:hypothetical protein
LTVKIGGGRMDIEKLNNVCYAEHNNLMKLINSREWGNEPRNLDIIIEFFERLKANNLPPPCLFDNITEKNFSRKIRYMVIFKKAFSERRYFDAAAAIEDFGRFSCTFFEPESRGMLLSALEMALGDENDILQRKQGNRGFV